MTPEQARDIVIQQLRAGNPQMQGYMPTGTVAPRPPGGPLATATQNPIAAGDPEANADFAGAVAWPAKALVAALERDIANQRRLAAEVKADTGATMRGGPLVGADMMATAAGPIIARALRAAPSRMPGPGDIWYHGTNNPAFAPSNKRPLYMTKDPQEAEGFARMWGDVLRREKSNPHVVKAEIAPGVVKNIDDEIMALADRGRDLGHAAEVAARHARMKGADYAEFYHPPNVGDADIPVRMALRPEQQVNVLQIIKALRGGR